MARYINADKLIAHLEDEIRECKPPQGGRAGGKSIAYGTMLGLKSAIAFADALATADVEPVKSWISVDERLPDKMQEVLAYRGEFRGGMMNVYTHLGNGNWEDDYGYRGNTEHEGITHWMPLPEAPKGE